MKYDQRNYYSDDNDIGHVDFQEHGNQSRQRNPRSLEIDYRHHTKIINRYNKHADE